MKWFKIISVEGFESVEDFSKSINPSFGRRKIILSKTGGSKWRMEVE